MGFQNGFRINTNTSAVNTYRSYSAAQSGLERNIERLSSGLRINRAADDTAGAAISQRMNNQIRGMQQANRNVQQANNMMQSAEGGLNEIHGILSRMRELAVQSASDGMNADDRASIELEYSQLKAEITRIGQGTEYNSMKLIDGSRAKSIQMASGAVDTTANTAAAGTDKVAADSVKVASFTTSGTYAMRAVGTDKMELYLQDGSAYSQVDEFVKAEGSIVAGNEIHFDDAGLVFKLGSNYGGSQLDATLLEGKTNINDGSNIAVGATSITVDDASGLTVNDIIQIDDEQIKITTITSNVLTVERGQNGTTAAAHDDDDAVSLVLAGADTDYSSSLGTVELSDEFKLVVDDSVFTTVQVGSNNDANQAHSVASVGTNVTENRITFNIADTTSEGLGISTTDLDSLGEAQSAINYLDAAIQKVNDERSNIGSLQNRFEFTSSNLLNSIQNNSASMSTIRDADFAVEAADLARNQILTQSGTAMLAQANQISQNVLSLLR